MYLKEIINYTTVLNTSLKYEFFVRYKYHIMIVLITPNYQNS